MQPPRRSRDRETCRPGTRSIDHEGPDRACQYRNARTAGAVPPAHRSAPAGEWPASSGQALTRNGAMSQTRVRALGEQFLLGEDEHRGEFELDQLPCEASDSGVRHDDRRRIRMDRRRAPHQREDSLRWFGLNRHDRAVRQPEARESAARRSEARKRQDIQRTAARERSAAELSSFCQEFGRS